MANSDDERRETREREPHHHRLVRSLGGLDTDSAGLVLIFLVFFSPGLAVFGYAAAEGLTASTWLGIGGALLGVCASLALVRDFLRWQISWPGALFTLAFGALLAVAYL
jgi:hypothetical protein